MRKRFQQEARLAARLIHPHIVAVLDYGEDDASSYLVMERLPGTTLRDEIARGPLTTSRVMLVITEDAHRTGGRPQVRRAASRHQTQQHPPAGRRPHKDHRLRDCQERRHPDRGGGGDRGHDAHRGRPGHARLSRARTEIGPPGDGTVRSLLGRRRHGGGTHGAASRSRCHPDGGATSPLRDIARRALATEPNERFGSAVEMLHALRPPRPTAVAAPQATTQPMAPRPAVTLPVPVAEPATVRGPTKPAEGPRPHRPAPSPTRVRRRRVVCAGATAAALIALLCCS